MEFNKGYTLYKARNDGSGAASTWSLSSKKDCIFLEMANQIGKNDKGNAKFDWENNKIRFKLGINDIGELLAVLAGIQDGVGPFDSTKKKHKGLFHTNPSGNAVLYFGRNDHGMFQIYLSVKKNDEQTVVQHSISKGEACVLNTLLRRAIEIIYQWN